MSIYQTEAFVVHLFDYGETSKIVQILTDHHGKLSCIAKGVKRKNNPWSYALDRLNRVDVYYTWKGTREVQTITEVSLLDNYSEIKKNIFKQTFASIILESAFNLVETEQMSPLIYQQVCIAFEHINNSIANNNILAFLTCWNLWRILSHSGIEPQLNSCIRCGKPISTATHFSWQGGVTCSICHPDYALYKNDFTLLQQIKKIENPLSIKQDFYTLIYFNRILAMLCRYISYQSGHPLKSFNVLHEITTLNQKGTNNEP